MAAGDTESLTISASDTDAEVKAAVEAKFTTVASGDIFITANHGGFVRIIQIKTA
jgi:ethanolamine utilization microcompartment shell protein EutL